jgi:hypothetical protein
MDPLTTRKRPHDQHPTLQSSDFGHEVTQLLAEVSSAQILTIIPSCKREKGVDTGSGMELWRWSVMPCGLGVIWERS